ncbi:TetR/AcrR family transcriptional regulator [Sphaerisporangium album]|uniref:TetR/AcrR family transcriptional regulator n=1 Tax=Sphaerisporangium album TaxID=509200 RepID=UPI0015F05FE1|nr:TetR family transcriptional regulator [Sphaerisporangium album]
MGLRERKKHQTRLALSDAAFELFLEQGFEATTVDQIAAAVDVSPRTFFRYFGSKEELALDFMVEYDEVVTAALAARPADEPPLQALAAAYRQFIREVRRTAAIDPERYVRHRHVMEANPHLITAGLARMADIETKLTAEVARRQGTDPDADPRPRLLVAFITSAIRVGFECATGDAGSLDKLFGNVEKTLALTVEALSPGWCQFNFGSSGQVATKASSPG